MPSGAFEPDDGCMKTTTRKSHLPTRIAGGIVTIVAAVMGLGALAVTANGLSDDSYLAGLVVMLGLAGLGAAALLLRLGIGLFRVERSCQILALPMLALPIYATSQWHGSSLQAPLILVAIVPLFLVVADLVTTEPAR